MSKSFFHIIARAGAGTGKTYSLVENYCQAFLGLDPSGVKKRPQQILALTFTQKAAHEMRIRIARKLNELLIDDTYTYDKDELRRILRALPGATIATFHSFCQGLLRQEAKLLGLDEQFAILSPHEERRLAKNILRPLINAHIEAQNPIIRSIAARFRLSAGLISSGLINGLLETYEKIAEHGLSIKNLKSPEPALSMLKYYREEIKKALDYFSALTKTSSSIERLAEISCAFNNLTQDFSEPEMQVASQYGALRQAVKGNFGDKLARQNLVKAVVKLGVSLIDYYVHQDQDALAGLLEEFHEKFEYAKLQENKLSYADLLIKTRDALALNTNLRRRVKQRFSHILIDEYQDTSALQEQIIMLIAENKTCESTINLADDFLENLDLKQGASLFVVGDKKQSIYGFRGANTNLFDRMLTKMAQTHEQSSNFEQKLLTINRRSSAKILSLVNLVSRASLSAQGYKNEEDLELWHQEPEGICELWVSEDDADLDKNSVNSKACAHGIRELLEKRADLNPSHIVILVRRIKSAMPIKEHLALLGIAARIIGGDGFFQRQEVVDLIAALKLINDPAHELACAITLRSPLVLLEDQDLLTLTKNAQKLNLINAENALNLGLLSPQGTEGLSKFITILNSIKTNINDKGLAWALDILIEHSDFAFNLGLGAQREQAWANVTKLISLATHMHKSPYALIDEYFDHIFNNKSEAQALGSDAEQFVTIMTIHQSKGLEFKVVVLADSESARPHNQSDFIFSKEQGLLLKPRHRPIALYAESETINDERYNTLFDQAKQEQAYLEQKEQARLLYVALTRAREEIYIVSSKASFSKPNNNTLLGLFLSASLNSNKNFWEICRVKYIKYFPPNLLESQNPEDRTLDYEIYKDPEQSVRWFSSQLVAPANWDFLEHINLNRAKSIANIDGNLAHHILGQAGPMLMSFENPDDQTLEHIISATFRSLVSYEESEKALRTLKACAHTLRTLAPSIAKAQSVIFEKPLFFQALPEIMIEGFADLVLEMPDFIGVIEFKSSVRLARHPDSYLQIFAYAEALAAQKHNKPIKYALLLVGSKNMLMWQDYNTLCSKALNTAIQAMKDAL